MGVAPDARASGGDSALGADVGHFGVDQTGATLCQSTVVHQVPVPGQAILGAVHAHGGHAYPVVQGHFFQLEGQEHGGQRIIGRRPQVTLGEVGLHGFQPLGIPQSQVLVTDPLAAGEHGIIELFQVKGIDVARHILKPDHGIAGTVLQPQYVNLALLLIVPEGLGQGLVGVQVFSQGNGVFQAQFGPGANGEVCRVCGIANQHHAIVLDPIVAVDRREIDPGRASDMGRVGEELMTIQVLLENLAAGFSALGMGHVLKAQGVIDLGGCFHDEGRGLVVELIGVGPDPAVLGLLKNKRERVSESLVGTQPDKLVGSGLDSTAKDVLVGVADF